VLKNKEANKQGLCLHSAFSLEGETGFPINRVASDRDKTIKHINEVENGESWDVSFRSLVKGIGESLRGEDI
jgi:hypothetical protein